MTAAVQDLYRRTVYAENIRVGDTLLDDVRGRRTVLAVSVNRRFDRVYIQCVGGGNLIVAPRARILVERDRAVTA